jgi:MFS transporter, CP family, cyanate transporter
LGLSGQFAIAVLRQRLHCVDLRCSSRTGCYVLCGLNKPFFFESASRVTKTLEPKAIEPMTTDWPRVALLVGAGCAAAAHIGKVAGALPVMTTELSFDLGTSALMTALYSLVAATCGLFFGVTARRWGAARLVVGGLLLASVASLLGGMATQATLLLLSRVIEGLGFIMAAVAAPALIMTVTRPQDRRLAMGLWGTYIPAGSSLMMLTTAATLDPLGWRGVWSLAAAVTAAMAGAVWLGMRDAASTSAGRAPAEVAPLLRVTIREACTAPSRRLAGCFMVYGAQYLAVTAFLPLLLVEKNGVSVAMAAALGAAVAAANIVGNVAAGWIGNRGWAAERVVAIGALGMGLGSIPVFADGAPLWVRVAGAVVFTTVGGLIPGTLLGAASRVANSPLVAAGVVGLMIQGAGVGQLIGPPIFARAIGWAGGWQGAWIFTGAAALMLLAMTARLRLPNTPSSAQ